jgi:hypothetical protein
MRSSVLTLGLVALTAAPVFAKPAKDQGKTKYYVAVMKAMGDPGVPAEILPEARKQLIEALSRRPEVTLAPEGQNTDDPALAADLKKKKMRGLSLSVRVTEFKKTIMPPDEGKKFQVLQAKVSTSLFGATIPNEGLAIGGEGDATVGLEVGKKVLPQDEKEALKQALSEALDRAVNIAMTKLSTPAKVPPKEKHKKH